HALGGIGEKYYTNSLEAFEENYKKGIRLFEIDLILTSDNVLVANHGWKNSKLNSLLQIERSDEEDEIPMSHEEFMSCRIYGKYTPLDIEGLADILNKYKDVYMVLDVKTGDHDVGHHMDVYREVVRQLRDLSPEGMDRLIPQLYAISMFDELMESYPWKSMVYTWYLYDDSDMEFDEDEELNLSEERGIKVMTMSRKRQNPEVLKKINDRDMVAYVFTVNDPEMAEQMRKDGVTGFYTDFGTEK
nr:hypothetical protein [Lachnospiraceae bacterium]